MRLFDLIWKATVEEDSDAIWEIILRFEPYIRNISSSSSSGKIDEDLMSYIHTKLHKRIGNFDVFREQGIIEPNVSASIQKK